MSVLFATASVAVGAIDQDGRPDLVKTVVNVDIKPDGYPNSVNPSARGVVPVAILGSDTFDVSDIDVTTLVLGRNGASPDHDLADLFTYNDHLRDFNLDGYMDLVTHYRVSDTGIACGDTSATLSGVFSSSIPCIDVVPSDPFPESHTVTAQKGPGPDCDTAVIDVVVTQVEDLNAGSFTVTFPTALASFSQASVESSILASDGAPVLLQTAEPIPGELLVGIARLSAQGVDVDDGLLIRLSFDRVGAAGTDLLDFEDGKLLDGSLPPGIIPGITCFGGFLTVEETTVNSPFQGTDSIRTVGCR